MLSATGVILSKDSVKPILPSTVETAEIILLMRSSVVQEKPVQKTDLAVCAVDATEAAVRSFVLHPMPPEETDYAVLMEAEHVSPVEMDNTIVDYQLFGKYEEGKEVKGMLVAAKAEAVRQKCRLAQQACLKPVLMDVDSLALINCFSVFGGGCADEASAIVHVNNRYTNLVIANRESLPFIRNISCRSGQILGAIADQTGNEKARIRSILFEKRQLECMERQIRESFTEITSAIVTDVSDTLKYYRRHGNAAVDRIKLCGDFACIDGFDELFAENLDAEVELWNPLINAQFACKVNNKENAAKDGCAMAVAMGLAMRRLYP